MISMLKHWLDPSYLYALEASPLGSLSRAQMLYALCISLGALVAWYWQRRSAAAGQPAGAATVALCSCLASLALLILRIHVAGPLSARVWYVSALTLALLATSAHFLSRCLRSVTIRTSGKALACDLGPDAPRLSWQWQIVAGLGHLAGLYILAMREGLGWGVPIFGLFCLLLGALILRYAARKGGRCCLRTEILTPLFLLYATSFLRWLVGEGMNIDVALYQAFPYPDLWSPWFDLHTMLVASIFWMVLATGTLIWRCLPNSRLSGAWPARAILILGLAWYVTTVAVHASHGATGSDPYCYTQMAIDLAERGSALHEFPLASLAHDVGIAIWPAVHVGYHAPTRGTLAPTVWPVGWPLLLALFYKLVGEVALRWAAPLCALLAALLTWRLAQAILPETTHKETWMIGGLAALITLTSHEATLRSLVPMADAAAQAFSVLVLLCLVRARRRDAPPWSALAGVSLGLAYFVRHPQLFLGLAILPLFLVNPWPWRRKLLHMLAFAGSALVCTLPDLFYHATVFGSPWTTESPEWFLISWRNIGPTFLNMLRDGWLRRAEFGYLWPFILYGIWQQWRAKGERPWAAMMWASFAGVLLFTLCYSALRFRDLIPLFPWPALWASRGVVGLWRRWQDSPRSTSRRILALALILGLLAARTAQTLNMPWSPQVWTFGYVLASERTGYAQVADALPDGAVVGTGLNSGAIELYSGHQAVRPSLWSNVEFVRFVGALRDEGRPLYLLDDGEEMERFLPRIGQEFALRRVGEFALPVFGLGGQDYERPAVLYALKN